MLIYTSPHTPNQHPLRPPCALHPVLSLSERNAINHGHWFSTLSPTLRHDILRCVYVERYKDDDVIAVRGEPAQAWFACAKGAIRVSSATVSNKQTILTFVEPGAWFGEVSILDGDCHTHNAYAHGVSSVVCVAKAEFRNLMARHVEFRDALLRLHARRIRRLYGMVDDLNLLPLRARLAKQLLHLVRRYGVPSLSDCDEVRIGLTLAQERLAQMLGASRQRVNLELKTMESAQVIRVKQGALIIRNHAALTQIGALGRLACRAETLA